MHVASSGRVELASSGRDWLVWGEVEAVEAQSTQGIMRDRHAPLGLPRMAVMTGAVGSAGCCTDTQVHARRTPWSSVEREGGKEVQKKPQTGLDPFFGRSPHV